MVIKPMLPRKADASDFLGRFREVISDPLNLLIERVPLAGIVHDNEVYLLNGNRVPISGNDAYYGAFSQLRAHRVGVLFASATADDADGQARFTAFVQALQQLGWTDGRNVRIDIRWGMGDAERISKYAAELVALAPDVILASGTPTVAPLLQATRRHRTTEARNQAVLEHAKTWPLRITDWCGNSGTKLHRFPEHVEVSDSLLLPK